MVLKTFFLSALFVTRVVWGYSFPDCANGPLQNNSVCDTSLDPVTRAKALVGLFTVDELISNTDNGSPGVPRLGLPSYQWWSEGLVSILFCVTELVLKI